MKTVVIITNMKQAMPLQGDIIRANNADVCTSAINVKKNTQMDLYLKAGIHGFEIHLAAIRGSFGLAAPKNSITEEKTFPGTHGVDLEFTCVLIYANCYQTQKSHDLLSGATDRAPETLTHTCHSFGN